MSEQRERLQRALQDCAERGMPETVDLWTGVEERISPARRRSRRTRFVPRTRIAWVVAAVVAVMFSTGAYGASKFVYEVFQDELPGAAAKNLGTNIYERKVQDEAAVTVEWAYVDAEFVVIGYSVEDLKENRRNAGHPANLDPMVIDEQLGNPDSLPKKRVDVTNANGEEFDLIGGTTYTLGIGDIWSGALPNTVVFETPENFAVEKQHGFEFQVVLEESPIPSSREEAERGIRIERKPPIGPFVFDFEVPVRPAPIIQMDQSVEASGVNITLERIVNSPARPQAIICFDPPNNGYDWYPNVKTEPAWREPIEPLPLKNGCWSAPLYGQLKGNSSITVTELWGDSITESKGGAMEQKTILGPWRFDFEVPEQ